MWWVLLMGSEGICDSLSPAIVNQAVIVLNTVSHAIF